MDYDSLKTNILEFLERQGDGKVTPNLDTIIDLAEAWINRRLAGYQREVTALSQVADASGYIALPIGFAGVRAVLKSDRPYQYAVSGTNLLVRDGAGGTFDVTWLMKLTPLADDNPTNWLIEEAPDAYLDACLMRASILLQDAEKAAGYGGSAAAALDELTLQNTVAQYANATMSLPVQAV